MPFYRRSRYARRPVYKRYTRKSAIPRLPYNIRRDIILEKSGVDTVPRLITFSPSGASINSFTFAGNLDAKYAFNPLNYLVATPVA